MITPYKYYINTNKNLLFRTKHHKVFDARALDQPDKWDRQASPRCTLYDINNGQLKRIEYEDAMVELI